MINDITSIKKDTIIKIVNFLIKNKKSIPLNTIKVSNICQNYLI